MSDQDLAAELAAAVRKETEEQPQEFAQVAKRTAAKKLMDAFQNRDEEAFLTALSELKEMED